MNSMAAAFGNFKSKTTLGHKLSVRLHPKFAQSLARDQANFGLAALSYFRDNAAPVLRAREMTR